MRFLALLLLLSCPALPQAFDQARLARIAPRMKEFVEAGKAAGIVTLVAHKGEVVSFDAVGYTDLETRQPMTKENIFQLHSMTKPIVALAAMQLAEEGRLSLADPVEKHLPEFRGQMMIGAPHDAGAKLIRKPARPITIRDLMTHTSGMMLNPPPGIGELHGALHKSLADVTLVLSQQPLEFEPGSKWQYSNTGIATLARIVEVISGQPLEVYMAKRIFEPLGMKDTYFFPPKDKWNRMPTAYILRDGKPLKYTSDPLGEGAMKFRDGAKYSLPEGGLYSTAADLLTLYKAILNDGRHGSFRLLSPAGLRLMRTSHTGDLKTGTPGAGWGLGWFVMKEEASGQPMAEGTFGHGGRYGTYCFLDPTNGLIGIFLIHREGGSDERQAFVQLTYAALQP
ncbi:MAG: beta-lactamase family protein [Bryobacterales bacterium]|nr:beta-lactamase family protein [Bryobacterales bacterium]